MKHVIGFVLLGMMLCGFQSARHTDFSGVWQLDLKKSDNLPESFQHVDSYSMEVKQTNDSVIVMVQLIGNGQNVKFPLTSYALDGSEVYREDTLRLSKRWSKSTWTTTGKKLIVDGRVEQGKPNAAEKYAQRDVWELINRNTLQISMTKKSPQGKETHSERRIFHRMK